MSEPPKYGRDDFGSGGLNDRVDVDALVEEIGLDESEVQWRKDFVGFDQEDVRRLEKYRDVFEAHAEQIAEDFYDNLIDYEQTVEVIGRSPKNVEQLKRTQAAYLVTLVRGDYGMEYFRNRARIGKLHDVLDMPMKHYLGQYGVYFDLMLPLVGERLTQSLKARLGVASTDGGLESAPEGGTQFAGDEAAARTDEGDSVGTAIAEEVDDAIRDILSILRIINLDMQVVTDTYIHSYSQEIETELERQRKVTEQALPAIEETQQAIDEVAHSTDEISELARSQSESVRDVSKEVSNISATVEEIAATADEVAMTSERAEQLAAQGRDAADEAVDRMEQVDDASRGVADDVGQLHDRIEEVDEIVEVINDIAEQTNILALNASIEAARAGEAGDGFAVVADEVKSLAEESQEHAGEIEELVDDIKDDASEAVESLDATTDEIDRGLDEVGDAMETLQEIANAVEEASYGIQEVSDATDEQATSAQQVATMVDELVDHADRVLDEIEGVATANRQQADRTREINETIQELAADRR